MNEQSLQPFVDSFEIMMRRQGWHFSAIKSDIEGTVIQAVSIPDSPLFVARQPSLWYEMLAENTFRKLLRAILNNRGEAAILEKICGNRENLELYRKQLEQAELITINPEGDWICRPALAKVGNMEPTLEWYITQWYRNELQAIAKRGVFVTDVRGGGDLDVVAFINDIRIMVECKTSKPDHIDEHDLRWFLQRTVDFNPEIAILLIDTNSKIDGVIRQMNQILGDEEGITASKSSSGLYWGMRNVFITNVQKSVGSSLDAIHRLYFSIIRHLVYPWSTAYVPPDYIGDTSSKNAGGME